MRSVANKTVGSVCNDAFRNTVIYSDVMDVSHMLSSEALSLQTENYNMSIPHLDIVVVFVIMICC